MNREQLKHYAAFAAAAAESWTERLLLWQVSLPKPWTFVAWAAPIAAAGVVGYLKGAGAL